MVQTATLSAQNGWQVVYADMPEGSYSIVEVDVPKGFTATYSQNGYEFTVTNTASLAQTGHLFWPIPVLVITGLCLIVLGFIVFRRNEE